MATYPTPSSLQLPSWTLPVGSFTVTLGVTNFLGLTGVATIVVDKTSAALPALKLEVPATMVTQPAQALQLSVTGA